jgi:hypothetical protein
MLVRNICHGDGRDKTCRFYVAYCEVAVLEKRTHVKSTHKLNILVFRGIHLFHVSYLLSLLQWIFTGLLSIAGLFLAENDLCMCKKGTVSADFAKRVPIWICTVEPWPNSNLTCIFSWHIHMPNLSWMCATVTKIMNGNWWWLNDRMTEGRNRVTL